MFGLVSKLNWKKKKLSREEWLFLTLANAHIFLLAGNWIFSHFECDFSMHNECIVYEIEFWSEVWGINDY